MWRTVIGLLFRHPKQSIISGAEGIGDHHRSEGGISGSYTYWQNKDKCFFQTTEECVVVLTYNVKVTNNAVEDSAETQAAATWGDNPFQHKSLHCSPIDVVETHIASFLGCADLRHLTLSCKTFHDALGSSWRFISLISESKNTIRTLEGQTKSVRCCRMHMYVVALVRSIHLLF